MTVVASPLFPIAISSNLATPLSGGRDSPDQSYRSRTVPQDGSDDERVSVPTAPQQWPRVFPGL